MNVSLTPELESFVNSKVESGRYTSASEVIREALRLLEEHERIRNERLAEFQAELDRRMGSVAQGRSVDSAVVREEIRRRSEARRARRS